MLMPKLSDRRNKIIQYYENLIDGMHQNSTPPYYTNDAHHHNNDDIISQSDQTTKLTFLIKRKMFLEMFLEYLLQITSFFNFRNIFI